MIMKFLVPTPHNKGYILMCRNKCFEDSMIRSGDIPLAILSNFTKSRTNARANVKAYRIANVIARDRFHGIENGTVLCIGDGIANGKVNYSAYITANAIVKDRANDIANTISINIVNVLTNAIANAISNAIVYAIDNIIYITISIATNCADVDILVTCVAS
jgi:hypothetical protein